MSDRASVVDAVTQELVERATQQPAYSADDEVWEACRIAAERATPVDPPKEPQGLERAAIIAQHGEAEIRRTVERRWFAAALSYAKEEEA